MTVCERFAGLGRYVPHAGLVMFAVAASGCVHSVFYDEIRDKQGQAALKAVAEVDLRGTVASMEMTFADLAEREEANARELQRDLFDREVHLVAAASSLSAEFGNASDADGLMTVLKARLQTLGARQPQYDELETTAAELQAALNTLRVRLIQLRGIAGAQWESCTQLYAAARNPQAPDREPAAGFLLSIPLARREQARQLYGDLIEKCVQIDNLFDRVRGAYPDGEIARYAQELADLEAQIRAHALAKRAAREKLDAALKAFEESGLKPTGSEEQPSLRRLQQRAEELAEAIELIAGVQEQLSSRKQVIAEEMLVRLEAALAAVAGHPGDGETVLRPEEQKAVAVVRALPALKDEADKLFQAARKPRLVPFLAAIEHHKLLVETFQARERIKAKQAAAARQRLAAAMNEARASVATLRLLSLKAQWAQQSISALEGSLNAEERAIFYRALATYADDVQRFRLDTAVWDARLQAAQHEESFVQAKYAAEQWDGLLDTMAAVLADYHAAGIKKSDLAEFFKAFGLVTIGVGVAQ